MIHNNAFRIGSTSARIFADRVHTGLIRWTVVVFSTFNALNRLCSSTCTAAAADVTAWTYAHHRADRVSWQYPAFGRFTTWFNNGARILASVIEAGQRIWTVVVLSAFWFVFWFAVYVRITHVMGWATTYGQMIEYSALG